MKLIKTFLLGVGIFAFDAATAQCTWSKIINPGWRGGHPMTIMDSCKSTHGYSHVYADIDLDYSPSCVFEWRLSSTPLNSRESHAYSYPSYTSTRSSIQIDPADGKYTLSVKITDTLNSCDTTITRTLIRNCNGTLDVQEITRNPLKLYPNPAADYLFISGLRNTPEAIVIYDLKGLEVMSSAYDAISGIDIRELATGPYILRVKTGEWLQTLRFTKI